MSYARTTPSNGRTGRVSASVRRLALPALLAFFGMLLFGFATPAQADDPSEIANGLRTSKVYVSSEAQGALPASARSQVAKALDGTRHTDIRVVVTKAGVSQQDLGRMLNGVRERVGKGDTYVAVTADGKMVAISKDLSATEINQIIARTAGRDIPTRITEFARLADAKAAGKAASARSTMMVGLAVLVLAVVGVIGLVAVAQKRRRGRDARQMAELKEGVQEDVTSLGEDIAALDLNVTDPALPADTRDDYTRALDSYDRAKAAVESAQRPEDMRNVTTALEDGRYYMTAVRARLAGEPVPERRAPCFFNPQHGPAVGNVIWTPRSGPTRKVPACAQDAARIKAGEDPPVRTVRYGEQQVPAWEAGAPNEPYRIGFFSASGARAHMMELKMRLKGEGRGQWGTDLGKPRIRRPYD